MEKANQKCPINRRKAEQEPDALENLLAEWMGQEKEPVGKADQKRRSSSRAKERELNTPERVPDGWKNQKEENTNEADQKTVTAAAK